MRASIGVLTLSAIVAACGGGGGDGSSPSGPGAGTSAAVARVQLSGPGTPILVGQQQQLTASALTAAGQVVPGATLTWSSDRPAVASVSGTGLVTGVAPGSAVIQAGTAGVSGSLTVTVQGAVAPTCTTPPVFTEWLIDTASVATVSPVGMIAANHSLNGRSYVTVKPSLAGVRQPLQAPGALTLVAASHYAPQGAPADYVPDWALSFDAGCGFTVDLAHVKDLTPALKAQLDTTIGTSSATRAVARPIPVPAGAVFGWYIRGSSAIAFDFIVQNRATTARMANPARYQVPGLEATLSMVCPYQFFEPARRAGYLALIGPSGQTVRFPGADCGTMERDVVGSVAGQWFKTQAIQNPFLGSRSDDYGDPLPIVLGPDSTVYVGNMGPSRDLRTARTNPTWRSPSSVTTSWCYEHRPQGAPAGWIWLRLNSPMQMDVAYSQTGACPAAFPATGWVPYYR